LDTTDKLRTFDTIPHLVTIIKKYIKWDTNNPSSINWIN
jgi:hypothetical protein